MAGREIFIGEGNGKNLVGMARRVKVFLLEVALGVLNINTG